MFLSPQEFAQVIDNTPLVSIDLLVRNNWGDILLGERLNRPAQGFWFVPGGRIQKGERLKEAFVRLAREELDFPAEIDSAQFLGVYEHFYDDHAFGEGVSTHYVVLAYSLDVGEKELSLNAQHHAWHWFSPQQLLADPKVHEYSKAYLL